jgi:hypothetical protein
MLHSILLSLYLVHIAAIAEFFLVAADEVWSGQRGGSCDGEQQKTTTNSTASVVVGVCVEKSE